MCMGKEEVINKMKQTNSDSLKLWVIQELFSADCAWWLIEAGIKILKIREGVKEDTAK